MPAAELLPRARHWAARLAEYAPQTIAHTKELLYRVQELSPEDGMKQMRQVHMEMRTTGQAADAINAFLDKKK